MSDSLPPDFRPTNAWAEVTTTAAPLCIAGGGSSRSGEAVLSEHLERAVVENAPTPLVPTCSTVGSRAGIASVPSRRCIWCDEEVGTGAAMARHVNLECAVAASYSVVVEPDACAQCAARGPLLLVMKPGRDGRTWRLCSCCWGTR